MKYKVTQIETSQTTTSSYSINGSSYNTPSSRDAEVSVTLLLLEYNTDEISSLDAFEEALRGDIVKDGAPSYHDLLKLYHPEFLL